jgi:predicted sulfurtransferase
MMPENKDLLCRSMLMQIQDPTQFRNDLFRAWDPLVVLGRIYVAKEGINAQLSLPADNFYALKTLLKSMISCKACD